MKKYLCISILLISTTYTANSIQPPIKNIWCQSVGVWIFEGNRLIAWSPFLQIKGDTLESIQNLYRLYEFPYASSQLFFYEVQQIKQLRFLNYETEYTLLYVQQTRYGRYAYEMPVYLTMIAAEIDQSFYPQITCIFQQSKPIMITNYFK